MSVKSQSANLILKEYASQPQHNLMLMALKERRQQVELDELSETDWQEIIAVACVSEFFYEQLLRYPHWIELLLDLTPEKLVTPSIADLLISLDDPLSMDEKALMRRLRRVRQFCLVSLIFLDVRGAIPLQKLTSHLTQFADACVNASLIWLEAYYTNLYGRAFDSHGKSMSLMVIGMGKLGGGELNLSSDIDLIFAFREHGDTQGGKKTLSHQEYFTKIGQKLILHLDQMNSDGFVFRVDMRLRPFGQSGALALNFDAFENYYQDQGRDWERYAMIKARVIAGNPQDTTLFDALRRPFVFRKYLDFSAVVALRDLKNMIAKEVQRKGIEHNIKLGEGGIREVEFIVQALQILHGGRDNRLQSHSLYKVLPYLAEQGYLTQAQAEGLWQAYLLLRRTEHALQAVRDEQTQLLPTESFERHRIAMMLGFSEWSVLDSELWRHRHFVHKTFNELIEDDPQKEQQLPNIASWRVLFKHATDDDMVAELTTDIPWEDAPTSVKRIASFITAKGVVYMQPIGQDRLAHFFASFMVKLASERMPDLVLGRVLDILEAIQRRTSYLVLLCENPTAITHLISLCRESAWFSEAISSTPMLLDELLDAETLFSPPDKNAMQLELRQTLMRLPEEDEEANMDALRRFKRSLIMRIAACDITERLPLMKVSDHLTWLAETILEQVLMQAWHYLTGRHGFPTTDLNVPVTQPQLVIVGYGKSGGWELGYDSDLDLVFIHNSNRNQMTDGERSVDNLTFYTRLGQRIIHLLTSFTASGRLYEVDMRLRPSGNSGLLVTSLEAFNDYQLKEAWVWEHQALTRARVLVTGNDDLLSTFNQVKGAIISQQRDLASLKQEVIKMREKMRNHLDTSDSLSEFDIKQGRGGIIDIEFMVQYYVLAWSWKYPSLLTFSDNIRQIEAAEKVGLVRSDDAAQMIESYKLYRAHVHRLNLQKQGRVVPKEALLANQKAIERLWDAFVAQP